MPAIPDAARLSALEAENARLIALLEARGISWRPSSAPEEPTGPTAPPLRLPTAEKLALFGRLFRGRPDVFPVRWESRTTGKSGYAPACANEWRPGVCEKPRIKCGDCGNRELIPLTDAVLFKHLAGDHTIGAYPLLTDDTCHFLAVDFDEAEWKDDAMAFGLSCRELGVPVALEVSRSGNGAHAWIFFDGRVAARDARRLGTAIRLLREELAQAEKTARGAQAKADALDSAAYDLKAVNPRARVVRDTRRPAEIVDAIAEHGRVIDEALAKLRDLLRVKG